ncbi:DeoR/GlpR family DNA-binding transcription regulator [Lihuaxuella thermophila]|uniref:DNA-binding transcriptional regulator of sugar metabolism, DeoR/GlpR family n=1 Tax=Lihuaxuella thermophila TaxID=1173111 RepID=A0A1H8GXX3_9BACL|nr:DeoR/GlpR family DNA-binding transcription regulator [Lihuaxuella thermophila]SEN48932.1 DNA-binding transcriptional regulator of sugar metabolism, DeoR/GlpR family [Lihuaxuella thermophila]
MYQEERLKAILDHLKEHKRISLAEICDLFQVSRDTARRDLVKLAERNAIIRTHGGALLPSEYYEVKPYKERIHIENPVKREIGKRAAELINDNDQIFLDTSTTVQFVAEHLQADHVTVVTNSIDIAELLSDREQISIYLPGGKFHPAHRYMYGSSTIEHLKNYFVNKAFISAAGISEQGLFYLDEEDGLIVREMISKAKQVIVLADHTKFGKQLFYRVCELHHVDVLITNHIPDEDLFNKLKESRVQIILTGDQEEEA